MCLDGQNPGFVGLTVYLESLDQYVVDELIMLSKVWYIKISVILIIRMKSHSQQTKFTS
ncbi:MAG: hypothetical protein R3A12_13905 [Ignavibacteria bacterium]